MKNRYILWRLWLGSLLVACLSVQARAQSQIATTVTRLEPHTICAGYTGNIEVAWVATDNGAQTQRYTVGVFPENATNTSNPVRTITSVGTYTEFGAVNNTLRLNTTLLNSLPAGRYKVAVLHNTIPTNAGFTNLFLVASPATAQISTGNNVINQGDAASVRLTLGGTGPWSYSYNDLRNGMQFVTNSYESSVLLPIYPSSTYTFSSAQLGSFSGYCGLGSVSGSTQIQVARLALSLTSMVFPNTCPGSTLTAYFTVSGTVSANTRYKLQLSDANGSFANPRELASGTSSPLIGQTPINDGPGSGYRVRIVSEGTVLTSNTFDLTQTRPAPPTVADYSFCTGTTPPAPTATGSNLQWFSNDGLGTSYGSVPPTPPSNQSSSYRVSQTVGGCASSPAVINVLALARSLPPTVTSPVLYCQNQTALPLAALGTSLSWSSASGQNLGSNSPTPPTTSAGTQTYFVTQNTNNCRSAAAMVTVTISEPPAAPSVTNPGATCQYAQVSNTVLFNAVVGQTIRWYVDEQGGTPSSQPPTPRTSTEGTERYYATQTINGCESGRARIEQRVLRAPDRPTVAANPVLFCLSDTPRSLSANGTNLRWYTQASGGSFTTAPPAPSTNQVGSTAYYVTQVRSEDGCESQQLQLNVQVAAQPSAPQVALSQFFCQNSPSAALRATGSGLQWTGPGIVGFLTEAPFPSTATPTTLIYQVRQQIGNCTGPTSTIQVVIRPQPAAPTVVSPLKLCQGAATRTLTATGDNLRWHQTASAIDAARSQMDVTPATLGVFSYYVKQVVNECESPLSRLEVRVSAPARATLSGDSVVTLFDSTAIRVRFTGDAPYTLTLWNGKTLTTTDNPLVVWEKPTPTNNTYRLQAISNDCGTGFLGNTYRLIVLTPLSTETPSALLDLSTYPNPATGPVRIRWSAPARELVRLSVTALDGRTVWAQQLMSDGQTQTTTVAADWPAGTYVLRLSAASGQRSFRLMVIR